MTKVYRLGDFELRPATRELSRAGAPVRLTQKPFQVLLYLVENRDRLVPRAELLERFWHGREVYDVALTRCLSFVRKALDDQGQTARYIETRWAEGYRYIGPLVEAEDAATAAGPASRWRRPMAAAAVVLLGLAGWLGWQQWGAAPAAKHVGRIAVLPVRNEASGGESWVTDGLTIQLIDLVSRIEGLTVIARNSTKGFTEPIPDARAIGQELGVDAILVPSVTREGGLLRLTARVMSTADGEILWNFASEVPSSDMMKAERDVAIALASHLTARLRRIDRQPHSEAAYSHYLRGRYLWGQRTPASLEEAIAEYEAALKEDPDYADAHAGLAETLLMLPQYASRPPLEMRARAGAEARAALRLDPDAARAHLVLGVIAQHDWDWNAADAHFASALRANPSYATAHQWRAESLCFRRRWEECQAGLRDARALDPLSPVIAMVQGIAMRWQGDYDGALAQFAQVAKRWPAFSWVEIERAKALAAKGELAAALPRYENALATYGVGVVGGPLVFAYARAGKRAEAEAVHAQLLAYGQDHYLSPVTQAIAELGLGRTEAALRLLERAVEGRDGLAIYLAVDECFTGLRDDARFVAILKRTGLA